jgi:hypothetical protein
MLRMRSRAAAGRSRRSPCLPRAAAPPEHRHVCRAGGPIRLPQAGSELLKQSGPAPPHRPPIRWGQPQAKTGTPARARTGDTHRVAGQHRDGKRCSGGGQGLGLRPGSPAGVRAEAQRLRSSSDRLPVSEPGSFPQGLSLFSGPPAAGQHWARASLRVAGGRAARHRSRIFHIIEQTNLATFPLGEHKCSIHASRQGCCPSCPFFAFGRPPSPLPLCPPICPDKQLAKSPRRVLLPSSPPPPSVRQSCPYSISASR